MGSASSAHSAWLGTSHGVRWHRPQRRRPGALAVVSLTWMGFRSQEKEWEQEDQQGGQALHQPKQELFSPLKWAPQGWWVPSSFPRSPFPCDPASNTLCRMRLRPSQCQRLQSIWPARCCFKWRMGLSQNRGFKHLQPLGKFASRFYGFALSLLHFILT